MWDFKQDPYPDPDLNPSEKLDPEPDPRVSEEPVYIHLFRQNPVFTSLHLRFPVHVVPPQGASESGSRKECCTGMASTVRWSAKKSKWHDGGGGGQGGQACFKQRMLKWHRISLIMISCVLLWRCWSSLGLLMRIWEGTCQEWKDQESSTIRSWRNKSCSSREKSKENRRIRVEQQKAMEEHTVPKIRNIYFQKWNCTASFLISTFMYLWAIYIFPRSVHLLCCSKYRR